MEIIPATSADASTLIALEESCFTEPWAPNTSVAALENPDYVILFARTGESTCGYILGWLVGDEAELARVGVLADWRGQRIGEQLTQAFMKVLQTRGARKVFLEVRESNAAARALYRKCLFFEIATRPNYYPDGEDAVVMCVHLSGD